MKKLQLKDIFSQRDPQWASVLLGNNTQQPFTIGNYGCLLTVLTIYLCALGRYETPVTLQEKLRSIGGFSAGGGDFIWSSLAKLYSDLTISYQSPRYESAVPDSEIASIKQLIDAGGFVIAEIDFNPSTISEESHYVGIYGYTDTDFYAVDPWSGSRIMLSAYGDIKRVVYRFTIYSKPLPDEQIAVPVVTLPIDWTPLTIINGALITPQAASDFIRNLEYQLTVRDSAIATKDEQIAELENNPPVITNDEKYMSMLKGLSQVNSKSDTILSMLLKDPSTVITKTVPPTNTIQSPVSTIYNGIKQFLSLKWK